MNIKYPWRFALSISLYYSTNGIYQGFISKFYQQAGMDGLRFVLLQVSLPLMALLTQAAWGRAGDRAKMRNNVLRFLIALSIVFALAYTASESFLWLLAASCLFAACYTSIQPMNDSILLESLQRTSSPFGPIRLAACLSFAVINLVAGRMLEGRFHIVPEITAGLLLLLFLSTYTLDPTPGHQRGGKKIALRRLLDLPHMKPLMALLMLLQLAMGYFYSYFSIHFTSLPGGSSALLGLAYTLSSTSEVPFLLFSDRLFRRFGAGRLMLVSAALITIRFSLLGFTNSAVVALLSQLLHSGGFIVMTVTTSKYVNAIVPGEMKASGQMLLSIIGFGVARVFGIIGGGLVAEWTGGVRNGFIVMAGISFLALVLFAPYFLRRPALSGEQNPARQ